MNEEIKKRVDKIQEELMREGFHFVLAYSKDNQRGIVSGGNQMQCVGLIEFAKIAATAEITSELCKKEQTEEEEEDEYE